MPKHKLEDHPLSAVRYFLFNIFAAAPIRKPRTLHVVVTGTHITEVFISNTQF